MKVIELYNLIVNRKELPEKIKVNEQIYTLRQDCGGIYWYGREFDNQTIEESHPANLEWILNLDVEIIEEIEKPNIPQKISFKTTETQKEKNKLIKDTLNQIIDYLEKGDKE